MMKKYSIVIASLFLFLLITPGKVNAHVLQKDGSIGAVLHIDPEDDPIVGQPANFFFEFKDTQNKFKPANCNCIVSIIEDGKEIYSQPLFQDNSDPSLSNASFSFTFPQKNIYQVKVVGAPEKPGQFQPFKLFYDLRISREERSSNDSTQANNNWLNDHTVHLALGLLAVAVTGFVLINRKKKQ